MGRMVAGGDALYKDKVAISKRKRLRLIKAHNRHNKPPSTMPATTTEMLTTTQNMNNAYNYGFLQTSLVDQFQPIDVDPPIAWLCEEQFHSPFSPCC